ncbi:MAG: hypothetical protein KAQ90_00650, partial [Melioribacteraceae bacterium]|nr:hypothetical protein [Melioribacteraceae bacterium]
MKTYLLFLSILISLGSLAAQNFVGKVSSYPNETPTSYADNDTLKILAVLVDFQEDIDDATFGNGKFGSIYTQDYGNSILDPLPHNKDYFEDHLLFAKNYFNKVSNGKLNINYTVLEDILTVSKAMRNYSPPINDQDNLTPLGEFAEETWELGVDRFPQINFSEYDFFVIFHAGVGKDVSLPGSIQNERDLPSVYLGYKTLQEIFG